MSAGVKSLLDVPATLEVLETLGVPVLGFRTDELPLFYSARGGPPVSARVETRGGGGRDRARALGARRRRTAARAAAGREPRRRRAADRGGAARGARARRDGPGRDAVRPLVPARAQRRPHARREPCARRRERGARRRSRALRLRPRLSIERQELVDRQRRAASGSSSSRARRARSTRARSSLRPAPRRR